MNKAQFMNKEGTHMQDPHPLHEPAGTCGCLCFDETEHEVDSAALGCQPGIRIRAFHSGRTGIKGLRKSFSIDDPVSVPGLPLSAPGPLAGISTLADVVRETRPACLRSAKAHPFDCQDTAVCLFCGDKFLGYSPLEHSEQSWLLAPNS